MTQCKFCGSGKINQIKVREMMYGTRKEFIYNHCINCYSLYQLKIPKSLKDFYPQNYYSYSNFNQKLSYFSEFIQKQRAINSLYNTNNVGWLISKIMGKNLSIKALQEINLSKKKSILDVGSGVGNKSFIHILSNIGFENIMGVDPFIDKSVYHPKYTILKEFFSNIEGKFDLITFNHSIEHFTEIDSIFKKALNLLSDNGTIIIRMPVAGSWAHRHYKSYWFQLDAPRHIHIFSILGLKEFLKTTTNSKLKIQKIIYDSTPNQFWGSELYKRGKSLIHSNKFKEFSPWTLYLFSRYSKYLNINKKGDKAVVYLKRN